jgi:pilus assembly protein CpaE
MSGSEKKQIPRNNIVLITTDAAFAELARTTYAATPTIELSIVDESLVQALARFPFGPARLVVVDVDSERQSEIDALSIFASQAHHGLPLVVVTRKLNEQFARALIQLRISNFLVKPLTGTELLRACTNAIQTVNSSPTQEAQILAFVSAVGGAGVTTLAIQAAMLLHKNKRPGLAKTCIIDLNFQQGSVTDYLDVEPRLNLNEIEGRPERLDRQLLEVMLSHHTSGLAIVAAPSRPAEMRSFDPTVVTLLLDLVSAHFDHVIIDMPRTWFAWTDPVLLGSNQIFVVSEATVPSLRHARQLVGAITDRLNGGPELKVLINRFNNKVLSSGLKLADFKQALGPAFGGTIPNDYLLACEAIDRGVTLDEVKSNNAITAALKQIILPSEQRTALPFTAAIAQKLKFAIAS